MKRALAVCLLLAAGGAALFLRSTSREQAPFDPYRDDFELSQEVQKHLWEIERRAFLLANEVAPLLAKALRDGDRDGWRSRFARGAPARLFDGEGEVVHHGPVEHTSWNAHDPTTTADVDVFVAWIFLERERFKTLSRLQVHFEHLVPVERDALDGPYNGTRTITLEGDLVAGGKCAQKTECAFVLSGVPDDVARRREWISAIATTRRVVRKSPRLLMEEATERSGIATQNLVDRWTWSGPDDPQAAGSLSSYLLDYDRDGRLDLLLCDRRVYLYRGIGGGRFEDVTRAAGLPYRTDGWSVTGGTVADFDNDGYEDVILDAVSGGEGRNAAFRNIGGTGFRRLRPGEFRGPDLSFDDGAVADFDNDGLVDLYLPNAGRRPGADQRRARWLGDRSSPDGVLLRNLGNWRFEDVTAKAGASAGFRDIFAAAWFDADADGDPDLLLAHHLGENVLLENRGDGTFRERVATRGFGGFSMGLAIGDLDGDGDTDAYVANMSSFAGDRILRNLRAADFPGDVFPLIQGFVQGNVVMENPGTPGVFPASLVQATGWAYGPALVDLDGDGRLDIYAPAGFQSVERGKPDG